MDYVLTRKELADRWKVTVKTIISWENQGVIQRIDNIPEPRYSLSHIQELEGVTLDKFSPLERRKCMEKIRELEKEKDEIQEKYNKMFKVMKNIFNMSGEEVAF